MYLGPRTFIFSIPAPYKCAFFILLLLGNTEAHSVLAYDILIVLTTYPHRVIPSFLLQKGFFGAGTFDISWFVKSLNN